MPNRNDLLDFLRDHYNLDEFKTLCFRLAIEYEDLTGESLTGRMRELIVLMERRERSADLQRQLERDHPDAYRNQFGLLPAAERPLTPAQAGEIQALAQQVGRVLGRESGRFLYQTAYIRLNQQFRVRSYRDIPAGQFANARDFLAAWLRTLEAELPGGGVGRR